VECDYGAGEWRCEVKFVITESSSEPIVQLKLVPDERGDIDLIATLGDYRQILGTFESDGTMRLCPLAANVARKMGIDTDENWKIRIK
jgi:hypothetical protein